MPYTERELEDWVCANIETALDRKNARVIGRQVRLPHGGILDVLALFPVGTDHLALAVIELKAGPVGRDAVAQLLSYMGALEEVTRGLAGAMTCPYTELWGFVAGPSLTTDAGLCLKALTGSVRFMQLTPRIVSEVWSGIDCNLPAEAVASTARIVTDGILDILERLLEAAPTG